jgi:hypothetical protein
MPRRRNTGWTWGGPNTPGAMQARRFGFKVPPYGRSHHPNGGAGTPVGAPASAPGGAGPTQPAQLIPDAQYLAEAAQRGFQRSQQLGQLGTQSTYDRSDTQEALRRMLTQRGLDEQSTRQNANRAGLFYSGQLGKSLGQVDTAYQQSQDDAQRAFDRREAARTAARQAIFQCPPIDEAAGLAESAARQVTSDQQAAQMNALAPPAPAKPKQPKPKQRPRNQHRPRRRR